MACGPEYSQKHRKAVHPEESRMDQNAADFDPHLPVFATRGVSQFNEASRVFIFFTLPVPMVRVDTRLPAKLPYASARSALFPEKALPF
jgi:hypothetical protein